MDKYELLVNPDPRRWIDVLGMAEKEFGWRASKHDYESYLNGYGKDGEFRSLFLCDTGTRETMGSALTATVDTEQGEKLMSIGWYYLKKELRGHGIGTELFNKITAEKKLQGTNMCLTAAPDMSVKYAAKSGFAEYSWHISVISAQTSDIDVFNFEIDGCTNVCNMDQVAWDKIVAFDEKVQGGVKRSNFLKCFFTQKGALNKFAISDDGSVIGYCNIRTVGVEENDLVIAPFYAKDKATAAALLKETLMAAGDNLGECKSVLLCPPKHNQEAVDIMSALTNGKAVVEINYPRQFTKAVIPAKEQMIFSISDYVLGHA
ncbi:hypothetical protein QR680_016228 [Steinernema hermaphroditum]|uniref:YitH/HolE acetyltransferase (GNAT) domain-containing protein n=1 Tax=Steinernema hermaphroditum TaxID=289476 RepID=A0AA39HAH7_9BILA|nr:hypothetical protein QR680_016228 [Steinernema hermaphroditum]